MAWLADQNYVAQINSNQDISIMIHFMEENIKRKLQSKYIFNTIRFKLYSGGYMKVFYSHKKKLKIISNNLNNHSSIKLAKHYKLQS